MENHGTPDTNIQTHNESKSKDIKSGSMMKYDMLIHVVFERVLFEDV
jgi:hypothetical protein